MAVIFLIETLLDVRCLKPLLIRTLDDDRFREMVKVNYFLHFADRLVLIIKILKSLSLIL